MFFKKIEPSRDFEIVVEASLPSKHGWAIVSGPDREADAMHRIFKGAAERNGGKLTTGTKRDENIQWGAAFPSAEQKEAFFADLKTSVGTNTQLVRRLG